MASFRASLLSNCFKCVAFINCACDMAVLHGDARQYSRSSACVGARNLPVNAASTSWALALVKHVRTSLARTLPSSTPHWSKELMFHTQPCTAVLCSYRAKSEPNAFASQTGRSSDNDGLSPGKVLCGMSFSGTPSARSCSSVLPSARASG